jgi:hypothetical protein
LPDAVGPSTAMIMAKALEVGDPCSYLFPQPLAECEL